MSAELFTALSARLDAHATRVDSRLDTIQKDTSLARAYGKATNLKVEDLCDRLEVVEKQVSGLRTAERVRSAREKLVICALGGGGGIGGYGLVHLLVTIIRG